MVRQEIKKFLFMDLFNTNAYVIYHSIVYSPHPEQGLLTP